MTTPPAPTGGQFCVKCGARIRTRGKFCSKCGAPVATGPPAPTPSRPAPTGQPWPADAPPVVAPPREPNQGRPVAPPRPASIVSRLVARIIDTAIAAVVGIIIARIVLQVGFHDYLILAAFGSQDAANTTFTVAMIVVALCYMLYFAGTEARTGRTIGKSLFGIRVVASDYSKSAGREAIIRNLVLVVPLVAAIAAVSVLFDPSAHRGIHDRLARTIVIAG